MTTGELNCFSQFKQLSNQLRNMLESLKFKSSESNNATKLDPISEIYKDDVINIKLLLSEMVACQNQALFLKDNLEEEFILVQEKTDTMSDELQTTEMYLQFLNEDLKEIGCRDISAPEDPGIESPIEKMRRDLDARIETAQQVEFLRGEEKNVACKLLKCKEDYDKFNIIIKDIEEFYSEFDESKPIYSSLASELGSVLSPDIMFHLHFPLYLVYMRISLHCKLKSDSNINCTIETSVTQHDFSTINTSGLPRDTASGSNVNESTGDTLSTISTSKYCVILDYYNTKVIFNFHPALNIISTDTTDDSCLLDNLYPNDTGNSSPNPAAYYILNEADPNTSMAQLISSGKIGKLYNWAQVLGGLHFLPEKQEDIVADVTSYQILQKIDEFFMLTEMDCLI